MNRRRVRGELDDAEIFNIYFCYAAGNQTSSFNFIPPIGLSPILAIENGGAPTLRSWQNEVEKLRDKSVISENAGYGAAKTGGNI